MEAHRHDVIVEANLYLEAGEPSGKKLRETRDEFLFQGLFGRLSFKARDIARRSPNAKRVLDHRATIEANMHIADNTKRDFQAMVDTYIDRYEYIAGALHVSSEVDPEGLLLDSYRQINTKYQRLDAFAGNEYNKKAKANRHALVASAQLQQDTSGLTSEANQIGITTSSPVIGSNPEGSTKEEVVCQGDVLERSSEFCCSETPLFASEQASNVAPSAPRSPSPAQQGLSWAAVASKGASQQRSGQSGFLPQATSTSTDGNHLDTNSRHEGSDMVNQTKANPGRGHHRGRGRVHDRSEHRGSELRSRGRGRRNSGNRGRGASRGRGATSSAET